MYYNKHILEAINRGVNIALDDFDFNDENKVNMTKPIIDNKKNVVLDKITLTVDMGLPSGTRWCMYNLGVDPNNLEKNSAWLGEHYQWAIPQIKSSYYSDNYTFDLHPYYDRKHMNPNASKYKEKHNKKYSKITGFWRVLDCHKAGYIEMDFEDDPAYVATLNKTFKYCTPTKHQFMELWRNCSERNVYNYNGIEGLAGKVFTSKRNGNEIFSPLLDIKHMKQDRYGKKVLIGHQHLMYKIFHVNIHLILNHAKIKTKK